MYIEYRFNMTIEQKLLKWQETNGKGRNKGCVGKRMKKWDFNAFEDENKVLIRDGYVYRNAKKVKGGKLTYY